MAIYTVSDIRNRYEDTPSNTTIYKYLEREELKDYVKQEKSIGKYLTDEGILILDEIRKSNEKYRPKKEDNKEAVETEQSTRAPAPTQEQLQDNTASLLMQELSNQLKVKDEQITTLQEQNMKLTNLLSEHVKTIGNINGTLQLNEYNKLQTKDNKEAVQDNVITYDNSENKKNNFFTNFFKGRKGEQ